MADNQKNIALVWFRQDLRLADNPALHCALSECDRVLAVFIDDPLEQSASQLGSASRVWLHHSLLSLRESLRAKGGELFVARGESLPVLTELIGAASVTHIYWNRCYEPQAIERDKHIKSELAAYHPRTFNGSLILEPWQNLKLDETPYRVFTPFYKAAAVRIDDNPKALVLTKEPASVPAITAKSAKAVKSLSCITPIEFLPEKPWHLGMMEGWDVGEKAAHKKLKRFSKSSLHDYKDGRNLPGIEGTSKLSPHLHFGEISSRQVIHSLLKGQKMSTLTDDVLTYAKEIVWREFAYSLLFYNPEMPTEPLDRRFSRFPWSKSTKKHFQAWKTGQTGVPIIDAGMRELYATGWMHNRVRMIVGSYLVKNLLIPWQSGEQWFRDTLIDADLASNSMGWQWVSGCGADAAPFFRVFNPVLQGEKFDKDGEYVSKWVPEIAHLDAKWIHKPWELDELTRSKLSYPDPLVDLKVTRQKALDAFSKIKGTK